MICAKIHTTIRAFIRAVVPDCRATEEEPVANAIITEDENYIVTEAGDYMIKENEA